MATAEPHRLSQYGTPYLVSFSYPEETNFVLNPHHPDFRRIRVSTAEPFEYDPRMARLIEPVEE
jgi:RES domain-containing protein